MLTIEQGLLICTAVITVFTIGFSLGSLSNRKDTRQSKSEDGRLDAWPRHAVRGYWMYHRSDARYRGRFMTDANGEVFFVCSKGAIFDSGDFNAGEYFQREPWQ